MTFQERYRKTEDVVLNIVKELTWVTLICFLMYQILTEAPPSPQSEEWARTILLMLGYAMIPGAFMKIYWFFTGIESKNKIV